MNDIRDKLIFAWNRSVLKDGISHDNKCILANIADDVFRAHNAELAATDSQQLKAEIAKEAKSLELNFGDTSVVRMIAEHLRQLSAV